MKNVYIPFSGKLNTPLKKGLTCFFSALLFFSGVGVNAQEAKITAATGTGFIENRGQITDQHSQPNMAVKYLVGIPGLNVQLKANSFSYDAYTIEQVKGDGVLQGLPFSKKRTPKQVDFHFHRIDIEFIGANPAPRLQAEEAATDMLNYYIAGNNGAGITGVRHYGKITYKALYPGIDLEFIARPGSSKPVEYNFIVHPGADLSLIRWKYKGSENVKLVGEKIIITTAHGELTESIPLTYEKESGRPIKLSYKASDGFFAFETTDYIKSNTLVIDPIPDLKWCTYLGGVDNDGYNGMCLDASGNIFASGAANSITGLATAGAFHVTASGKTDAILSKYSGTGTLLWSTYFGGSEEDASIAHPCTDPAGNIFLSGHTMSLGLATPGAAQTTWTGTGYTTFFAKFTTNGTLTWCTYFDGEGADYPLSLESDASGNIVMAGYTNSTTGIATPGAHQVNSSGDYDAFLAKFNNNGGILWCTYIGGAMGETAGRAVFDAAGNIFVAGYTASPGMATPGASQEYPGGGADMFLSKYSSNGNLLWCTYRGGSLSDAAEDLVVDAAGNVYLAGWSNSTGHATPGAYQSTLGGGSSGVIAKYNTNGVLQWCTYYGADCSITQIANDRSGSLFFGGGTSSATMIATPGAPQPNYTPGGLTIPPFPGFPGAYIPYNDAFIVKMSSGGVPIWGTYMGGVREDMVEGLATDGKGNVYVAGYTGSDSGIVTAGAHQTVHSGGRNDCWLAAYEDLVGENNASAHRITFPSPRFCSGNQAIQLELVNRGNNNINTVKVDWELDGVRQNSITVNNLQIPFARTAVSLGNVNFPHNTIRTIKAWTSMPNGVMDTVRYNDTLLTELKPGLNGNYTIGGKNPDYAGFSEAADDLNAYGVCGPVIFTVMPGTYQESVTIGQVKGASKTNNIRFAGAGVDSVTLSFVTTNLVDATINLKNASHISFSDMRIMSDATVIDLEVGSDSNRFERLHVFTDSSQTTFNAISLTRASNNLFDSLYVHGGNNGIKLEGDTSYDAYNTISNSFFYGQFLGHINATNQNYLVVHGNTMPGYEPVFSGIILQGVSNFKLSANAVYSNGITLTELNVRYRNPAFESLIANNMISVIGGAVNLYDARNISVYHNSLMSLGGGSGLAVLEISNNKGGLNIRNNHIVRDNFSGVASLVYSNDTGTFVAFNHNNYYPSTAPYEIKGITYNDFNDLKINLPAFNQNSHSVDPLFVSSSDLHSGLYLQGTFVGVGKDIDGNFRCMNAPNVGADDEDRDFVPGITTADDTVHVTYSVRFQNDLAPLATAKGLTFSWYINGTKVSDSTNLDHVFSTKGNYKVKLVAANCAMKDSAEMTVTVLSALPTIIVLGNNPDSIRVYTSFADAGVTATNLLGFDISKSVVVKSGLDSATTGTYLVWYIAQDSLGNTDSVSRTVKVYDDIAPEIILMGNDTITLEVFNSYTEAGLTVTDNYCTNGTWMVSGNIDSSLTGFYELTYVTTDCEGNTTSVKRWVKVQDTELPVLKLTGSDTITIEVHNPYNEPGANATDNYCINGYQRTGTVDTAVLGTYELTYEAVDCEGNKASAKRWVEVVDTTAPVITLVGADNIQLSRWEKLNNPGYQVSDNYYAVSQITVDSIGDWVNSSEEGLYYIQYRATDPSGNTSLSAKRFIDVRGYNSVKDVDLSGSVKIYPNPGTGRFVLEFNDEPAEETVVMVYDVTGKEVYSTTVNTKQSVLQLDNLAGGVYQLNIRQGNNLVTLRIVKK